MRRRPAPLPLLTDGDKPRSKALGFGAEREPLIPTKRETEAQKAWVRELRARRWLRADWRMGRPSGGDVPDAKWAGIAYDMGQDPFWPDLMFAGPAVPHGRLHGMEWKLPGERMTEGQEARAAWFVSNGWPFAVVTTGLQAY